MTRGRILYVEDNFENRILIKRILESEGYTVVEAENGLSGIVSAETSQPDLILMDINLPDIDGYECAARIRKNGAMRYTPIVALTANVMEGDRQRAVDAGLDGYIPKPIDVDLLPRLIADHLRIGSASRTAGISAPEAPSAPASAPLPSPAQQRPSAPLARPPAPRVYSSSPPPPPPIPARTFPAPPPPKAPTKTGNNGVNPGEVNRE